MARVVSGFDHDRALLVGRWPVSELLENFEALERQRALDSYRHAALIHATTYPVFMVKKRPKPPTIPRILRPKPGERDG